MRTPYVVTMLLLLAWQPAFAADTAEAANVADFNAAWKIYIEARDHGDDAARLAAAKRALDAGRKIFDGSDEQLPVLLFNYAGLLVKSDQAEEASVIFEEALGAAELVYGEKSAPLIVYLESYAGAVGKANADGRQPALFRRALRIAKAQFGDDSLEYGLLAFRAGVNCMESGRTHEGRDFLRAAQPVIDASSDIDPMQRTLLAFWLGKAELAEGRWQHATRLLLTALEGFAAVDEPMTNFMLEAHEGLVRAYEAQGMSDAATQHCLAIGASRTEGADIDFVPLYVRVPAAPMGLMQRTMQGYVDLKFTVDRNGYVTDPVVVGREGGPSFEARAVEAVKHFRFAPRFENGVPVATSDVRTRINFNPE